MPSPANRPAAAPVHDNGEVVLGIAQPPEDLLQQVQADVNRAGGELIADPEREGSIGATMFDLPGSEDDTVTVLLPREQAQQAPSQSLVRIRSRDGRKYLGIVTAGPALAGRPPFMLSDAFPGDWLSVPAAVRLLDAPAEQLPQVAHCATFYYSPDLAERTRFRMGRDGIEGVFSDGTFTVKFRVETSGQTPGQQRASVAALNEWLSGQL